MSCAQTKRQLEEDADREIEELKEKYEQRLAAEREVSWMNMFSRADIDVHVMTACPAGARVNSVLTHQLCLEPADGRGSVVVPCMYHQSLHGSGHTVRHVFLHVLRRPACV